VGLPAALGAGSPWTIVRLADWQDPAALEELAVEAIISALAPEERPRCRTSSRLRFIPFIAWTIRTTKRPLLLILDQFEEYFLYRDRETMREIETAIAALAAKRDLPLHFLFVVRDDGLHHLDQLRAFIPNILHTTIELGHLDDHGVTEAIRGPIARYNEDFRTNAAPITIDDRLVSTLMRQLKEGDISSIQSGRALPKRQFVELPYLQLALTNLWLKEGGADATAISETTLNELGGVSRIVEVHVKDVMARLPAREQELCAKIFDRLVTPIGSKVAYPTAGLATPQVVGPGVSPTDVETLLNKLTPKHARILKHVTADGRPGFEIFHDVLAPPVLEWTRRFGEQQRLADEAKRIKEREEETRALSSAAERRKELEAITAAQRATRTPIAAEASEIALGTHPPRPRLTVRVGFAGHRPNKLDQHAAVRAERQLPSVFAAIEKVAVGIYENSLGAYAQSPPVIRLICGVAEGADQLAVSACPANWIIEALLPFPQNEYLKDFETSAAGDGRDAKSEFLTCLKRAASVTELPLPKSGQREQGYSVAGGYLLRQVDLLVVAWDGKPPRPGGTGALAREAVLHGIPVIWLSTVQEKDPRVIQNIDFDGAPVPSLADDIYGTLLDELSLIFCPLADRSDASGATGPKTLYAGLDLFYKEVWRRTIGMPFYDMLRRMASGRPLRIRIRQGSFESSLSYWDAFMRHAPEAKKLQTKLIQVLAPRYVWVDMLAVHFANMHRSAEMLKYLLATVVVSIGLGGIFTHEPDIKAALGLLGLFLLIVILNLASYGRRQLWEQRWLQYRALAENLRHGRFLAFIGEFGRSEPRALRPNAIDDWIEWYYSATMREIELPGTKIDGVYQWSLLDAILAHEIDEQRAYHRLNSVYATKVNRTLSIASSALFGIAGVTWASFISLIWFGLLPSIRPEIRDIILSSITFSTVTLPVLGMALDAIRLQGGFAASAVRSSRTDEALASLESKFKAAQDRDQRLDETAELLVEAGRIMSPDNSTWQELFGGNRLTLPA
jgi:hypothetical protein